MIRNDVTSEPLSIIRFIKSKTNVYFFLQKLYLDAISKENVSIFLLHQIIITIYCK